MRCKCITEQRRLTPAVFNLKQYMNMAETMVWEIDSCVINQGTCDLKNYDAFLVLCVGGRVDEVMLTKEHDPETETMKLIWNVGDYATALKGYTKYQIIFRSSEVGSLGVIGADDASANGIYTLTDATAEGTLRTYINPNGYVLQWDKIEARWCIQSGDGVPIDHQWTPSINPYCGAWNTLAVSNNVSAVWVSDEAVMYISETIAADEHITANYPTILRQVWEGVRRLVLTSGASVSSATVTEIDWQGEESPFYVDMATLNQGAALPYGASIAAVIMLQEEIEGGGYSDVANVNFVQDSEGKFLLYSPEKVTGRVTYILNGINAGKIPGNLTGENIPIQEGSPASIKQYFDDKMGNINAILDNINGEEV